MERPKGATFDPPLLHCSSLDTRSMSGGSNGAEPFFDQRRRDEQEWRPSAGRGGWPTRSEPAHAAVRYQGRRAEGADPPLLHHSISTSFRCQGERRAPTIEAAGRGSAGARDAPAPPVLHHPAAPCTACSSAAGSGRPWAEEIRRLTDAAAVAVLIGPEGDFSTEEVAVARSHGARPARLGPGILRSETAAVVMLAVLQHTVGVL